MPPWNGSESLHGRQKQDRRFMHDSLPIRGTRCTGKGTRLHALQAMSESRAELTISSTRQQTVLACFLQW
jgi:hypothetical protein